jgi:putative FmdB family regulatory protein
LPTYVYRCEQCGNVIERRQSFQDAPLTDCESCQGQLKRVMQPVGIIFKGSGFYSTDNRAGGAKAGNGSSEKSESTSASESKPEPKKDSTPAASESKTTPSKDSGATTTSSSSR